eukprot:g26704.t1
MRSGPLTDKVRGAEAILNKQVDHLKAVTWQTGKEQNIPSPPDQKPWQELQVLLPMTSIEETTESEMNTASILLLLEEKEETLPRYSGSQEMGYGLVYTTCVRVRVRGLGLGQGHHKKSYKRKTSPRSPDSGIRELVIGTRWILLTTRSLIGVINLGQSRKAQAGQYNRGFRISSVQGSDSELAGHSQCTVH